jgi:hypothetical protein
MSWRSCLVFSAGSLFIVCVLVSCRVHLHAQGAKDLGAIASDDRLFDALGGDEQAAVVRLWSVLVPYGVETVCMSRLLSLLQVRTVGVGAEWYETSAFISFRSAVQSLLSLTTREGPLLFL